MKRSVVGAMFLMGLVSIQAQKVKDSVSTIEEVELFGEIKGQPKGLDIITRLPLKPKDQIQNISVISHKAISEMGALTITDAAKNVPGVVLFSTYGGGAESMSIRGYRGTPTLKNGVLMDSDFRTSAMITDMQGVESIQVIRGAAAITQGIGNSLGAAGGVINIVTKTPRFINSTNIGFRYGSWDTFRPTLDFQRVLDSEGKVAVRLNVAYQKNNSFTDFVRGERVYVNPSVAIRPDNKTNIILQMDYLNNQRTPNRGTVNLAPDNINDIYDAKDKFFGFESDKATEKSLSYMISVDRALSDKLKIRAVYMASDNSEEGIATGRLVTGNKNNFALRKRSVGKYGGEDKSKVFQVDLVGHNIKTGILKHTFQLGFDWKQSNVSTYNYDKSSIAIDVIDVTGNFTNTLSAQELVNVNAIMRTSITENPSAPSIGVMVQEVMEIGEYVKLSGGIRYSKFHGNVEKGQKYAWDPSAGVIISPIKNINLYGSYTTSTSLRGNQNPLQGGGTVGPAVTEQWEAGVKTEWFDEKLRFNVNLFQAKLKNMSYRILDANGNNTPFYGLAGNLNRKGVEVEMIGKILPELEIIAGYAYLDAQYKDSPSYVDGSAPIMAPKNTANAWLNYTFRDGVLKGLNFGGGMYYVGERPSNDYVKSANIIHDTKNIRPFDLNAYTTINAQIGYTYRNASIKVFANNLTNAIGYSAYYRGGYLNRIDPRNFAIQLNYKF